MTDDRIAVTETIPLPDVLRALTRELTAMTGDLTSGFEPRTAELTVRLLIDADAGEPRFHVVGPQTPEPAGTTTHTLKLTLQPLVGDPTPSEFVAEPADFEHTAGEHASGRSHSGTIEPVGDLAEGVIEASDESAEATPSLVTRVLHKASQLVSSSDETRPEDTNETRPETSELVQPDTVESYPRHLTAVGAVPEPDHLVTTEPEQTEAAQAETPGTEPGTYSQPNLTGTEADSSERHDRIAADRSAEPGHTDEVRAGTSRAEMFSEPVGLLGIGAESSTELGDESEQGIDPAANAGYADAVHPGTPHHGTDFEPVDAPEDELQQPDGFNASNPALPGTSSEATDSEPLGFVDGTRQLLDATANEAAAHPDHASEPETSREDTDSEPIDAVTTEPPHSPGYVVGEPVQDVATEAAVATPPDHGITTDTASAPTDSTADSPQDAATADDNPTSPIPRTPEEPTPAPVTKGSAFTDLDDEHAEVIARYEKILVDRERAMGPLHRHTLISAGNLARAYREAGRSSQAIDVYERVLTDSESTFGPQDLDTLIFRGSLARCYREAGRMVEAVDLYERTLADSEQGFGPDHKNTLTARHNLALAYREYGRLNDAIELYRTCLVDSERLLGSNHRDTLITCDSLASCLREAGNTTKATALDERLLTARRRVLGPEHPDTLHSTVNLASDRAAANRAGDAADLYEQALSTGERVLGPDHPISERARIGLAHAYAEVGRASEAADLFERLLADCERQLGPDHRHTLIARNNLAVAYHDAGRYAEAIEAHTRTADDRERLFGPDHPDTLKSREHLAYSYEAQLLARTTGPQIPVPQE